MTNHTKQAIKQLEKAQESLALAGQPDKSGKVSNLKRELEISEE